MDRKDSSTTSLSSPSNNTEKIKKVITDLGDGASEFWLKNFGNIIKVKWDLFKESISEEIEEHGHEEKLVILQNFDTKQDLVPGNDGCLKAIDLKSLLTKIEMINKWDDFIKYFYENYCN